MKQKIKKEEGSSLIETALVMPVLLLLLIGAVDLGRGYYAAMEVSSAAEAGALYGIQSPSDIVGMVAAAKLDATDVPGMTITSTPLSGCECFDGSKSVSPCGTAPPTCGIDNAVDFVEVDTSFTYVPLLTYPGITTPIILTGKERMRMAIQ
jgi:hypothetical protein